MSVRITKDVARPQPVTINVNGRDVSAYEGESLATALIAADILMMSLDAPRADRNRMRTPYCNMGVCFDCLVDVEDGGGQTRVRACLTPVRAGLRISVAPA
jgi:D-hydroxyproline dehydrogenase subunit gamma